MEYENQQNGIFQKTTTTTLNSIFLEYGIFQEYSKKTYHKLNFHFFGIWNIMEYRILPIFHSKIFFLFLMQYGIFQFFATTTFFNEFLEYGIFQKKSYHNKNMEILEYGRFLEYSKKNVPKLKK